MRRSSSPLQKNIYDTDVLRRPGELKDKRIREILVELIHNKRCRILDVGCGDASLLEPFCKLQECFGVDISEVNLRQAQNKGMKTYCIDLENEILPFENDFFHLAICSETIEHLLDPDNLLMEVHRTLKFGGTFILTFPNVNQPISWLMQVLFDLPPRYSARFKSPHVRDYTLRVIKNVLANSGFEILDVTGTYIYPSEDRISQWLARSFPRLSEKVIVVSKKHSKTLGMEPRKVVWNILELIRKK